jgi:hypothetical protein
VIHFDPLKSLCCLRCVLYFDDITWLYNWLCVWYLDWIRKIVTVCNIGHVILLAQGRQITNIRDIHILGGLYAIVIASFFGRNLQNVIIFSGARHVLMLKKLPDAPTADNKQDECAVTETFRDLPFLFSASVNEKTLSARNARHRFKPSLFCAIRACSYKYNCYPTRARV